MNALVGYTGFVGSNLYKNGVFDFVYNSKNIAEAFGTAPELLIYAGIKAEKYLANNNPEEDLKQIETAKENITKINPKKLVLISTIDVFKVPSEVDENSIVDTTDLHVYGYNRFILECWVREAYPDALIIRLPALYGINLKKNFIYDFINFIPTMLKEEKYFELVNKESELSEYYIKQDNGFYKVKVSPDKKNYLKNIFRKIGFSALNFTDSRSKYQFYNLDNLWTDIQTALNIGLKLFHPATAPISITELYYYLTGNSFINELTGSPANYNYRTIYYNFFGGKNGYIADKMYVLEDIRRFISKCNSLA